MELNERIKLFITKSKYKIVVSNLNNVFKYGLLSSESNYNICNWYTEEEFLLFLELYYKKIDIILIEESIDIIRQKELSALEITKESQDALYAATILELIKAVTNLKDFSLVQQSQLINLFK